MISSAFRVLVLSALLIVETLCWASKPPQKPNDLFAKLSQQAEEQYQKNNSEKKQEPAQQAAPVEQEVKPSQDAKKGWSLFDYFSSQGFPILGKHKKFSDEWWKSLFGSCKGCTNKEEKIDCKKMLADNPQWKEVEGMNDKVKQIVMKRALKRFNRDSDACNLACAVCAGGNPDERLEGSEPHTALHVACGGGSVSRHYGLFNLLLNKRANPKLACMPDFPINFVPKEWKDELVKHGAKETYRKR